MSQVYQRFIDRLAESSSEGDFRSCMIEATSALDLPSFAYLALPARRRSGIKPRLISTYPSAWTDHYIAKRYESVDPVIRRVLNKSEPFHWGLEQTAEPLSRAQLRLMDEATSFGLRCGWTMPIHDSRGTVAAITFASEVRTSHFARSIELQAPMLHLIGMMYHAHARRKLSPIDVVSVGDAVLSPREYECLKWASAGKTAWEVSRVLGITPRTVWFHLDNAKAKLGIATLRQAIAIFAACRTSS